VRSLSSLAGKYLPEFQKERFYRNLQLANKTSLVDPKVSGTSPSGPCVASQYFPTLTDTLARENRGFGMDIHGPVYKSPQAYQ
jgi:hypothetical protein